MGISGSSAAVKISQDTFKIMELSHIRIKNASGVSRESDSDLHMPDISLLLLNAL